MPETTENSLMVVLDREEYCFLYDRGSLPELLEAILVHDAAPDSVPPGFLNVDHAREIARGLIGRAYQQI